MPGMVADAVPAASAETHRLRKSGEYITFGSLKQVATRGMGTRTKDVPKLSTWLSPFGG